MIYSAEDWETVVVTVISKTIFQTLEPLANKTMTLHKNYFGLLLVF